MDRKELFSIASSQKDLLKFPKTVKDEALFALGLAQEGETYENSKPLKGFSGTSVTELIIRGREGTFRVVYTVKFKETIYVLHAFQKKSKTGIKTDKQDIELIHNRLNLAEQHYKIWSKNG